MSLFKLLSYVLIAIWVVTSIFRSGLFVIRIVQETRQARDIVYPDVIACGEKPTTEEKLLLFYYRNLGKACEGQ